MNGKLAASCLELTLKAAGDSNTRRNDKAASAKTLIVIKACLA